MRAPVLLGVPRPGRVADLARARIQRSAVGREMVEAAVGAVGGRLTGGIHNTPQGWRSEVVVAATTLGLLVVKAYRDDWPDASIENEHSILEELRRLEYPSARLRHTADGGSVPVVEGRRLVVFDHIAGVNPASMYISAERRQKMLVTAARLLAQMHRQLETFVPAGAHHVNGHDEKGGAWYIQTIDALSRQREVGEGLAAAHDELCRRSERIGERLGELERLLEDVRLPETVVHGDFGLHNLIFSSVDQAVVHDFELARRERRLVDLVPIVSRLRPRSVETFVDAYRSEAGVNDDEWASFPLVWEEYRLRGAVRSWDSALRLGSVGRIETALRRSAEADRLRTAGT